PIVQRDRLAYEAEAQAGALAARGGARQRVEALGDPRQRIVRDRVAGVEDADDERAALRERGDAQRAAFGREVERVVDQVRERLAQEEALAEHRRRRRP